MINEVETVDEEKLKDVQLTKLESEDQITLQTKFNRKELEVIDNRVGESWTPLSLFFLNDNDVDMYLDFLRDERMISRFQKICSRDKNLKTLSNKTTWQELELHYRDESSGVVIGHIEVWKKYQEWKMANNLINQNEENVLNVAGEMMLEDAKFSEYAFFTLSYHGSKQTEPNWEKFDVQLKKALKRQNKVVVE